MICLSADLPLIFDDKAKFQVTDIQNIRTTLASTENATQTRSVLPSASNARAWHEATTNRRSGDTRAAPL
jgi:hypothetical protein